MKTIDYLKENSVDVDKGLELLGDIEFYNETLTEFYNSLGQRLVELDNYKNTNDMENYGILAHSIKSDCKYLGLMNLADLSYQHEMAGKSNDINFVNTRFNQYVEECKKVEEIVKNYLEV